jgi:type III secretory pathway component EscV
VQEKYPIETTGDAVYMKIPAFLGAMTGGVLMALLKGEGNKRTPREKGK